MPVLAYYVLVGIELSPSPMATQIWVSTGTGNGLLPDSTKPLPEPVLSNHH